MVDLTKDKIFSNSFKILRDFLIDNITDIEGRFKTSIIHSERQYPSATGFCGYPYIHISPSSVEYENPSNDGTVRDVMLVISVEVLSDVVSQIDTVSDQMAELLNSVTQREILASKGFRIINNPSSEGSEEDIEGKKVFVRTFTVNVTERLEVS